MVMFGAHIRRHAFQTIHDFDNYEDFEAEMIIFGETLPIDPTPTSTDPHHRRNCRGTARWAWERKDTIIPYDQFVAGAVNRKNKRRERIRQLRAQGLSYRAIATEVGCSATTVRRTVLALHENS